jgi:hypothetical protein
MKLMRSMILAKLSDSFNFVGIGLSITRKNLIVRHDSSAKVIHLACG